MKTREFPRGMTFIAVLAALLLAFPGVGLAGEGEKADEKANQEYEPPTEEQQQEQEEAWPQEQEQEEERQTERERRQEEAREERAQRQQQAERQKATQTGQTAQVTLSVRTASAEELTNQPQQYFGELVQVSAQVDKKHGKHMLTLQPAQAGVRTDVPGRTETAATQGDNLLVIIPSEASADIPENESLEIVGHVRPLLWTEFERDFAWFDMDLFQEFKSEVEQAETVRTDQPQMREETRPVLIATSIKTEDGKELLKEQEGAERQRQPGESGDE